MLFNSLAFLLIFLPATVFLYWALSRTNTSANRIVLAVASFVFYAYWDWRFLPLLVCSIAVNYTLGMAISKRVNGNRSHSAKAIFIAAITFNLILLGVFKYANLVDRTVSDLADTRLLLPNIILPIGISFFTFTQIAFLVDTYKEGVKEYRFWDYALFVSYFPHQIAGPILHHREMMTQFRDRIIARVTVANIVIGMSIFSIGLAKKVLLADTFETSATPVFDAADQGYPIKFAEAWGAALAYTLQLYFDFSAYCDMAIGISLVFGIRLPANFNSPYKATNIIDFWRRWHMTLSRFLRSYLYIPLGGNRNGKARRYLNLLLTMGLGGLWHGASWTFLLWGLLHGMYLAINHGWQTLIPVGSRLRTNLLYTPISWGVTMVAVMIGWVFFRAATVGGAFTIVGAMFGGNGIALPVQLIGTGSAGFLYADAGWLGAVGGVRALFVLGIGLLIVLVAPNLQQVFSNYSPVLDSSARSENGLIRWRPTLGWAILIGVIAGVSVSRLGNDSAFLYFNF
jgi:alginate O-acetyltransferase complex protein AlgI